MNASAGHKDGGPSYDLQCRRCRLAGHLQAISGGVTGGAAVLLVAMDHTLLMIVASVGFVAGLAGGVVASRRGNHSTHVAPQRR